MELRLSRLINKATLRFRQETTIPEAYQDELDSIHPVVSDYADLLEGTTVIKRERFYGEEHPLIELMRSDRKREGVLLWTRLFHAVEKTENEEATRKFSYLQLR